MNRPTNIRPGKTPAKNKRAIDTSAATPYTINIIDGGINKPNVPEPAKVPIDNESSYPRRDSSGSVMRPIVAAVAADEPETAAKIPQLKIFTCSSLPGNLDRNGAKPWNKSSERLVRNKISPIHINNGNAVKDQPVVALHEEVPNNKPILLFSTNTKPMTAKPVSVNDTHTPLRSMIIIAATRMNPINEISKI